LNSSGPQAAVTGTGAAANLYTFTIPGGTMSATSCIKAKAGWQHTTGTASTTYTLNFGGATSTTAGTTTTSVAYADFLICNNGATNSQFIQAFAPGVIGSGFFTAALYSTAAVDTTVNQSISFQFTVAGTDAVTPKVWLVENVH